MKVFNWAESSTASWSWEIQAQPHTELTGALKFPATPEVFSFLAFSPPFHIHPFSLALPASFGKELSSIPCFPSGTFVKHSGEQVQQTHHLKSHTDFFLKQQ